MLVPFAEADAAGFGITVAYSWAGDDSADAVCELSQSSPTIAVNCRTAGLQLLRLVLTKEGCVRAHQLCGPKDSAAFQPMVRLRMMCRPSQNDV
jgi:hypothetical protein